jgi:hypothetical protein
MDKVSSYQPLPEPRGRFSNHEYAALLAACVPVLADHAGAQTIELLSNLLQSAIILSRRPTDQPPDDYSYVWRPAIEDHRQNLMLSLPTLLVSATRDAAEWIARKEPSAVPGLIRQLESRPWLIFRRIALHVLRLYPGAATDLVIARLTDRANFDAQGLRHEYALLMREQFAGLPVPARAQLLRFVEEGPVIDEDLRKRYLEWTGKRLESETERTYIDSWRLERLAPMSHALPKPWKERYDELVARLGEPTHAEFLTVRSGVHIGPTSPKTANELRAMDNEQILSLFREWKPSDDLLRPTPEGLGRVFTEVVQSDPTRFATQATLFQGCEPTYVRALIMGLYQAVAQGTPFPWLPVLELCRWTLTQPRELPGRSGRYDLIDPGWVWTWKAIADLLSRGFEQGAAEIPAGLRRLVWDVLRPLTDDPDPKPEVEIAEDRTIKGPATVSINTVRGAAMHAIIRYALWIRRNEVPIPGSGPSTPCGFSAMPEVRDILEAHLDPSRDPSPAIRSVYGQWFPWLVLLDRTWATSVIERIFKDNVRADLSDAAWNTYITFCPPYDEVFDLLRNLYRQAIMRLNPNSREPRQSGTDERLAEHLMVFYWRGKIKMDGLDDVLTLFFERADDQLRGHALDSIGRGLYNTEGQMEKAIVDRLKALWLRRLTAARAATETDSYLSEIASFGWWFASGKFEDDWSIEQLRNALELVGKIEPDHLVIKRLATLSHTMPTPVLRCLDLMVAGAREGWRMHAWSDEMRVILSSALKSGDEEARRLATDLINRLSAQGNLEFRSLLA